MEVLAYIIMAIILVTLFVVIGFEHRGHHKRASHTAKFPLIEIFVFFVMGWVCGFIRMGGYV